MIPSKNNGFTANDIERYHSGKMTPEERHALEKAVLDDPFLADALEGYVLTSTPAEDLQKIQSQLTERLHRKKRLPVFQNYKWLSAAAIVLILAGAGWFAYTISSQEKNSIATAPKEEKTAIDTNTLRNQVTDSSVKEVPKDNAIGNKQIKQADQKSLPFSQRKPDRMTTSDQAIKNEESLSSKIQTVPAPQNDVASTTDTKKQKEANTIRAVPEARAAQPSSMFFKEASDSTRIARKMSSGSDTLNNLNVVLHRVPVDSGDVVVVGYGAPKKTTAKFHRVTIDTLEPAKGYSDFDDYIADNLRVPEEFKDKSGSGEVQLSFDVDSKGQPVNITVVKSLCQKCDEEAVRLLKEGPKWKKKKNKNGKLTIRF